MTATAAWQWQVNGNFVPHCSGISTHLHFSHTQISGSLTWHSSQCAPTWYSVHMLQIWLHGEPNPPLFHTMAHLGAMESLGKKGEQGLHILGGLTLQFLASPLRDLHTFRNFVSYLEWREASKNQSPVHALDCGDGQMSSSSSHAQQPFCCWSGHQHDK